MDGLIIKPKWVTKIVNGEKVLEIRGSNTSKVGKRVYLLESGSRVVRGECIIERALPITKEFWNCTYSKHCVDITYEELIKIYKTPYAWELKEVKKYAEEVRYKHPKGAVIWVKDVEKDI